ncbi:MAG: ABC transporter ATP-binding protein [Oscillospiraceae bacterium]|nr:ABC transporter ATP-binding protein [Oscillospiraceae bacterium]
MKNPINEKNRDFKIGFILNIVEGLLSGSNFMLIYMVFQSFWAGTLTQETVFRLTAAVAAILVLRLLLYGTGYVRFEIGAAAVSKAIRLFLGDKLKKVPLSRFTLGQTGSYLNVMTYDVNSYEVILRHKIGDIAKYTALAVMLIFFVATMWLPAAAILLVVLLLTFPTMKIVSSLVKKYGQQKNRTQAEAVNGMVEYINGIQTFRAYGTAGEKNEKVIGRMKRYSQISYLYEMKLVPIGFIRNVLSWCSLPLIMWLASGPWLSGEISSPAYFMICLMSIYLAKLSFNLVADCLSYQNDSISKEKILELMEMPEETGSIEPFVTSTHEITFQNVSFSYVQGEPVLKNVSFSAPDQKLTAIVGDSGGGKSTILNLIAKYYEADSGTISIGGKSIGDVAAERVLDRISMVDQDVFLFNNTVRENIRHARPDATDAEIEAACREANCDSFIRRLANGYDTPIGENGNLLSGGERQRLSIARAILKNSPILLLDEATASLDIENELAVKQAIVNLLKAKKTVVMIAHTLSIVRNASQILVVSDGRIVESGTHTELLAKGGKYAAMWNAEQKLSA